jgi:hypothetical protein
MQIISVLSQEVVCVCVREVLAWEPIILFRYDFSSYVGTIFPPPTSGLHYRTTGFARIGRSTNFFTFRCSSFSSLLLLHGRSFEMIQYLKNSHVECAFRNFLERRCFLMETKRHACLPLIYGRLLDIDFATSTILSSKRVSLTETQSMLAEEKELDSSRIYRIISCLSFSEKLRVCRCQPKSRYIYSNSQ